MLTKDVHMLMPLSVCPSLLSLPLARLLPFTPCPSSNQSIMFMIARINIHAINIEAFNLKAIFFKQSTWCSRWPSYVCFLYSKDWSWGIFRRSTPFSKSPTTLVRFSFVSSMTQLLWFPHSSKSCTHAPPHPCDPIFNLARMIDAICTALRQCITMYQCVPIWHM